MEETSLEPQPLISGSTKLPDIVESVSDAFLALDRDWRVVYVNARAAGYVGKEPQELIGRDFWEALPEARGTAIEEHYRRAMAEQRPQTFTAQGPISGAHFELSVHPSPNGLLIYARDISQQYHATQTQRQLKDHLQLALSAARMVAWHWDPVSDRVLCSEGAEELWGRREGRLEEFLQSIHPQDRPAVEQMVRRGVTDGQGYSVEYRIIDPQGGLRWVHTHGLVEHDAQGKPARLLGVTADISARRRAEQALREEEAKFRRIVETANEGICLLDAQGRITFVNQRMIELLGYSAAEMLGRYKWGFCFEQDVEAMQAMFARRRTLTSETTDARFRCKSGREIWVQISARSLFDDAGNFQGALNMFTDVTQRRQVEEAVRQLNESLERRVAERTAELEQRAAQLRVLAAELTQAEQRERRRLAETLHDDLQQILVAVQIRAGALRRVAQEPLLREGLQQLDALVRQSINVSRSLTSELSPPVLYDADLATALQWLARRVQEQHGIQVQVRSDGPIEPATEATRVFLFHAVRELLLNVVKHAGVEHAQVDVASLPDDRIHIVVSDPGVGFDPAKVEELRSFGLFSLRERLELLGGELTIDSAPGRGTRVSLVAPALRPEPAPARPVAEPAAAVPVAAGPDGRKAAHIRVLIADDHAILRQGVAGLLDAQPDLKVIGQAEDGVAALEAARTLHPDVVVMDVTMPRMNGVEATRQIRREMPQVRVIGLSMHNENDLAASMRSAGAADYLTKGGPAEQLLQAIRRCVAEPAHAQ